MSDSRMPALLNGGELQAVLGVSARTFYRLKKQGRMKMFEVARPLGQRRYSSVLVRRYLNGESMSQFGSRRS